MDLKESIKNWNPVILDNKDLLFETVWFVTWKIYRVLFVFSKGSAVEVRLVRGGGRPVQWP